MTGLSLLCLEQSIAFFYVDSVEAGVVFKFFGVYLDALVRVVCRFSEGFEVFPQELISGSG
jgi:hypothetical protein